jgi:hypothetical protein
MKKADARGRIGFFRGWVKRFFYAFLGLDSPNTSRHNA